MVANRNKVHLKTRTSFFLDLAQNAEQRRFHTVTVECMFPGHKNKSMTCGSHNRQTVSNSDSMQINHNNNTN